MTKMFGNVTTAGLESAGDRIGGGRQLLESGIYTGTVKLAYAGKAKSSASQSVTVHLDINGQEHRETFWVTNKQGENFYADKQDPKKKFPIPGYASIDELCLVTTGFPLSEQDGAEKVTNLWDNDLKKEVPTKVPMLVDLLGKTVTVAIFKQKVDKQALGADNKYHNTGEFRDENVVDKFFHEETGLTANEITSGIEEPVFKTKWAEKNTGVTLDKSKGLEGKAGVPGQKPGGVFGGAAAGAAAGNQGTPAKTSIFQKKTA